MRSKLEENIADLLEELNVDYEYESEKLSYVIEAKYIPDFKVGDVYLEAKGYFPSDQRRKMKAVKKANPELDIRIIFQNPLKTKLQSKVLNIFRQEKISSKLYSDTKRRIKILKMTLFQNIYTLSN